MLIPMVLIFAVMYLLVIRPNSKRKAENQKMLADLRKGEGVVTSDGIIGRIVGINGDRIALEVQDGVRFQIQRSSIGGRYAIGDSDSPKKVQKVALGHRQHTEPQREKAGTVRSLGVRFEIAKVDDSSCGYGEACWRIFWQVVNKDLLAGTQLRDGDTNATPDRENVYCLSITWIDASAERMAKVREALEGSKVYTTVAATPRFVEGEYVIKEPLVDDGRIDLSGSFVGQSYRARVAFEAIEKGCQGTGEAEQVHHQEKAQSPETIVGNLFETGEKNPQRILCSDNSCPCTDQKQLIIGKTAYLYISQQVVDFRKTCLTLLEREMQLQEYKKKRGLTALIIDGGVANPFYLCEIGARQRGLDLAVALADAKQVAETGFAPLRPTPKKP